VLYIGNAIPKISAPGNMDLREASFLRFYTNKTVFGITAAQMTPNHLLSKGTKKIRTVHQGGVQDIIRRFPEFSVRIPVERLSHVNGTDRQGHLDAVPR